ncbi:MAG: hypothetical protein IKE76_02360 [Clostridia bacterium]|nr:hypothetical protein [Clostridia bacterium]
MKKLLCLALCLCMVFGLCAAQAELKVPVPDPSQEALAMEFLGKLIGLIPGLNPDEHALHMALEQGDASLFDGLLQLSDGLCDLNATVGGAPVQAQFTADAVLIAWQDQVYRLPYKTLSSIGPTISSEEGNSVSVNPEAIRALLTDFFNTAILPSVSTDSDESGEHIHFDLTQERLAQGLIAMGDAIAADAQLSGLFERLGLGDYAEIWPQLRDMLEAGQVAIALRADITTGEGGATLEAEGTLLGLPFSLNGSLTDAEAAFEFKAADALTLTGRLDNRDGGYECHISGIEGVDIDIVYAPAADGWKYSLSATQDGVALIALDAGLTAEAFDAGLTCRDSADGAPLEGSLHVDLDTGALAASLACPEEMGGLRFDLTGEKTDTGYHLTLTVKQQDVVMATVDALCTETEELLGLEIAAYPGATTAAPLMTATFAYAKANGAFTLRYDDISGNYCDGKGTLTEEKQTCNLEYGARNRLLGRFALDRLSNDDVYSYRVTVSADTRYNGNLITVYDFFFEFDKETGGFRGWYGNDEAGGMRLDYQGIVADGLLRFHLDSFEYGRFEGLFELSARWGDDTFSAEFTCADSYDVWTGSLLTSPALKTLSLSGEDARLYAALAQNADGLPTSFRFLATDGRYSAAGITIDSHGVRLVSEESTTVITGAFKDGSTYCVDIAASDGRRSPGNRVRIEFTVAENAFTVTGFGERDAKLFEARLELADKTDVASLADREGVVEITPEMLAEIIEGMTAPADAGEPVMLD